MYTHTFDPPSRLGENGKRTSLPFATLPKRSLHSYLCTTGPCSDVSLVSSASQSSLLPGGSARCGNTSVEAGSSGYLFLYYKL
eukprot:2766143-Rhodomonas_salina.1